MQLRHLYFALCLPAFLTAQQVPEAAGFDVSAVADVVHDDAGAPWAIGCDYKAALLPGAVEFVPALGEAVPHNRTLRLRLHSIRRGDTLLHFAAAPLPAPIVADDQVTYQRGDVLEHWRVAPRGMEQSFVFAERPAGDGDLVVRTELGGNLRAELLADGTLRFTDGAVGGVYVGAVTGVDAIGARCRGSLALVDGQLEYRLPDAFVDTARLPLVLDPWIATAELVVTSGNDDTQVRGALRPNTYGQSPVWAWCRTYSASDKDVYALSADYPGVLAPIAISANVVETAPALGMSNLTPPCALVAWQEGPAATGPWTLKARQIYLGSILPLGQVSTIANDADRPSLCSNRTGGAQLLAYREAGVGIVTRTLTPTTLTTNPPVIGAANVIVPAVGPDTIEAGPELSDSIASGSNAAMVYETTTFIAGANSLVAIALAPNGSFLGSFPLVLANGSGFEPAIGGDGAHFRALYRRAGAMWRQDLTWNGTTLAAQAASLVDTGNAHNPSVTWCGDRYLTAWERTVGTFDIDVVVQQALADGTVLGTQPFEAMPNVVQTMQLQPQARSGWATGGDGQRATVVWTEAQLSGPSSACTRTFVTMTGVPPVNFGGSCLGNSCTSLLPCGFASGPFAPGNQNFEIRLQYQDQSAPFALLSLALPGQAPVGCGPCLLMVPLVTVVVANAPGELSVPWPLPFQYSALGFQVEFQWAMFGSTNSPCPLLPNITAYNRVLLTFAE